MADKKNDIGQDRLFHKEITKMPDEHYSGDKPNPNLYTFIEQHIKENPYDTATDEYDVRPGVGSIKVSKRNPIYGLHAYDSKKPPEAVQKYIEHFTGIGDLVFDPFVGSGMTAVACLLSRRRCLAVDLSPLATFIASQYCTPVDLKKLVEACQRVMLRTHKDRDRLYSTTCGRCGGRAEIYYTVYSQTYQCTRCMSRVSLFDALAKDDIPNSGTGFDAFCPNCSDKGHPEPISTRQERYGYIPVLIEYQCDCSPREHISRRHNDSNIAEQKLFSDIDVALLRKIEKDRSNGWYPTRSMLWADNQEGPWGVLWRPYHGDIRRVDQFFTPRNLEALSCLLAAIDVEEDSRIKDALRFIFSAFVLSQSKLQRYHPGSTFPNMIAPGLLYVAPMNKEYNVFQWFEGKIKSSLKGFAELQYIDPSDVLISTESATLLDRIPTNSIDYIFTDPPYSGRIQYAELNFIQEAWLGFNKDWREQEIIVNPVRGKGESEWNRLMRDAFQHCYRVLKPGRWLSLCYHDSAEGTWAIVQDLLTEIGFIPEAASGAVTIDTKEKSLKQITADKITKRDLVINFRKPRLEEITEVILLTGEEDESTFSDKIRQFIGEYLESHPGSTKDHIYDEVVSRMVRAGHMEPHNFEELLRQVADEVRQPIRKDLFRNEDPNLFGTHEVCRWYLKESQIDVVDAAESAKEDAAADKVGEFVEKYFKEHPEKEGVHYSDIFEHFIYTVKDKPRRPLAEWLLDYFFKTEKALTASRYLKRKGSLKLRAGQKVQTDV
jgi:DNA modification methylase